MHILDLPAEMWFVIALHLSSPEDWLAWCLSCKLVCTEVTNSNPALTDSEENPESPTFRVGWQAHFGIRFLWWPDGTVRERQTPMSVTRYHQNGILDTLRERWITPDGRCESVRKFSPTGVIRSATQTIDGLPDGTQYYFHDDGGVYMKQNYCLGVLEGETSVYLFGESTPRIVNLYHNNVLVRW